MNSALPDIVDFIASAKSSNNPAPIGYSTDSGGMAFLVHGALGITTSIPYSGGFLKLQPCPGQWNATIPGCHTATSVAVSDMSRMDIGPDVINFQADNSTDPSIVQLLSAPNSYLNDTYYASDNATSPDLLIDTICSTGVLSSDRMLFFVLALLCSFSKNKKANI